MKKTICFLAFVLTAVMISACGGASLSAPASAAPASSSMSMAAPSNQNQELAILEEEGYDIAAQADGGETTQQITTSTSGAVPEANRKLVKTAYLSMETKEFDATLAKIKELIAAQGGYLELIDQYGGSSYYDDTLTQSASITARIPVDKLDGAVSSLSALGNVTQQSEQVEDISDTYFDSEAHLKSLKLQEERLLDILSKAQKLEDVITLEDALSRVRYEIESLTARLRRYDSQVSYSTLRLELQQVSDLSVVKNSPTTFGQKVQNAAGDSVRLLRSAAEGLVLTLVALAPLALVVGAIVALVLLILRAVRRRRGPKDPPAPWKGIQPPPPPPSEKD